MKYVVALGVLIVASVADASHCVVHNQVYQTHHAPYVVATPAVLQAVVPVYSFGYGGTDPALLQILERQIKATEQVAEALATLKGGSPQAEGLHMKVFRARCAQCHEKAVAQNRGGGFVLLEGGQLRQAFNVDEVMKVSTEVSLEKMPKGGKLTREESLAIQGWVSDMAAQVRAERLKSK